MVPIKNAEIKLYLFKTDIKAEKVVFTAFKLISVAKLAIFLYYKNQYITKFSN